MVSLYMDVHVPDAITRGLRFRGVDVLTAQEDGTRTWEDAALLDRAGVLGRVVFTMDADFLIEARRRQAAGESFAGVLYIHQQAADIGPCVRDLELIAFASEPAEYTGRVRFLPL